MASANAGFTPVNFTSFVNYGTQTTNGTYSNTSNTLTMSGNNWLATQGPFNITANTVMEVRFSSTQVREIHGIGFDTDLNFNLGQQSGRTFQLAGSQSNFGIQDFNTYSGPGAQVFTIDIGSYFTGNFDYLVFINDDDANEMAESVYFEVGFMNVNAPSSLALVLLAAFAFVYRAKRS